MITKMHFKDYPENTLLWKYKALFLLFPLNFSKKKVENYIYFTKGNFEYNRRRTKFAVFLKKYNKYEH